MKSPHQTFITFAAFSLLLTTLVLLREGRWQDILSMLTILLPVLAALSFILVVTRKYWKNSHLGGD